jgi:hypothetical protein
VGPGAQDPIAERVGRLDQAFHLAPEVGPDFVDVLADARDDLDRALEELVLVGGVVPELRQDLRCGGIGGQGPRLVDDLDLDLDPQRGLLGPLENDVHGCPRLLATAQWMLCDQPFSYPSRADLEPN